MSPVKIELPADILLALGQSREQFVKEAKFLLALKLDQEGDGGVEEFAVGGGEGVGREAPAGGIEFRNEPIMRSEAHQAITTSLSARAKTRGGKPRHRSSQPGLAQARTPAPGRFGG